MLFKQLKNHPIIINTGTLLNEIKSAPIFKQLIEHPVIIVLIFASILRFWGIWHGYPFSYYPDEEHFMNRAVSFGSGDLNPHWFHKPAFLMYILFFEYGLFFVIGKITGMFSGVDSFAIYYFQNPWPFILIGRITVTLFGIATIYVVYKIGEQFLVKNCRIILCNVSCIKLRTYLLWTGRKSRCALQLFLQSLSLYFLLKLVNNSDFNKKDYILAGTICRLRNCYKILFNCIYYHAFLLLQSMRL